MNNRSPLEAFEQRIAAELQRYASGAFDPTPASQIAAAAMRPRGLAGRARNVTRSRRFLLLSFAAVLLVPAAYIAAISRPMPQVDPGTYLGVFVRRTEAPDPGVDILAVRQDGAERLLRHVSDSVVDNNTLSDWGRASTTGWIALATTKSSWPMVVVNLRDSAVAPWVVPQANLGAIGPRWSPTGLLAAPRGMNSPIVLDPEDQTINTMQEGASLLHGGGPSIAWTADGAGLLGSVPDPSQPDGLRYVTVPIDGRPNIEGTPLLDDPAFAGMMGIGPKLRICPMPDERAEQCPGESAGSIQLVQPDGTATTIYRGDLSSDHAVDVQFAEEGNSYWALFDRNAGRQLVVATLTAQGVEEIATIDRAIDWEYVSLGPRTPDETIATIRAIRGNDSSEVLVPVGGRIAPSSPAGRFAGFMAVYGGDLSTDSAYIQPPPRREPTTGGEQYRLPSLDQLIAEELKSNPGRTVMAQGGRDGSADADGIQTDRVVVEETGQGGDLRFYCVGGQPATVRLNGAMLLTTSCLQAWPQGAASGTWLDYKVGDVLEIDSSVRTSWRLLIFLDHQ